MTEITRRFSDRPSDAVIDAVAAARGVDPLDLDVRLYDAIDPGALDRLFEPRDGAPERMGSVTFRMGACEVTVRADGLVEATLLEETGEGNDGIDADDGAVELSAWR